jgi:hypothetical protein
VHTVSSPVPYPQWFEVNGQANLTPPIHLGSLAIQLWQLNLCACVYVCACVFTPFISAMYA